MSLEAAQLEAFLAVQRRKIEYWRESPPLKSAHQIQAELQPRLFESTEAPPLPPRKDIASRHFWRLAYNECARHEPHSIPLIVLSGIGTVVVLIGTCVAVSIIHNVVLGTILGLFAGGAAGAGTFGLAWFIRHREIVDKITPTFNRRFNDYWSELLRTHAQLEAEYDERQLRQKVHWDETERQRIDALQAMNRDPARVKINIQAALSTHAYLGFHSHVMSVATQSSIVLRTVALKSIIEPRTKAISEKTGKLIWKSKSAEEKIAEYEWFLAGTALSAISTILNSAPFLQCVQIAICSQDSGRDVYHVCGEIERRAIPAFPWAQVDPVALLRRIGFRIEGCKTKELTGKPEWLDRLDRVRIDIPIDSQKRR